MRIVLAFLLFISSATAGYAAFGIFQLGVAGGGSSSLLLEDGFFLLLEDGSKLLLE